MVQGINELRYKFLHLVPKLVEDRVRAELVKQMDALVADLKARAPVYTGPETHRSDGSRIDPGALRDSIRWVWGKAPKGSITLGEANVGGANEEEGIRITVIAGGKGPWGDAFYARWVEFGTVKWAGSPFFWGTYRDRRRRIRAGITRAIRAAIKEANNA